MPKRFSKEEVVRASKSVKMPSVDSEPHRVSGGRADPQGFETKSTRFPDGWMCKVTCKGMTIVQCKVTEKRYVGTAFASMLRWVDKLGYDSPMADAARDRGMDPARSHKNHDGNREANKYIGSFEWWYDLQK